MKLLLIEDNEADRVAIERAFKAASFKGAFLAAEDAEQSWSMIAKETPDLIILDLNMPGKDGRQLLKEIKASQYKRIPVIIMTSSTSQSDVCHCYHDSACSYFSKPMSFQELKALAKKICDYWSSAQFCRG